MLQIVTPRETAVPAVPAPETLGAGRLSGRRRHGLVVAGRLVRQSRAVVVVVEGRVGAVPVGGVVHRTVELVGCGVHLLHAAAGAGHEEGVWGGGAVVVRPPGW